MELLAYFPSLLLFWTLCSPCHCALYDYLAYCDEDTTDVTVRIVNDVTEPRFDLSVPLRNVTRTTALGLLEEAADVDERFRFTVDFSLDYPSSIVAINDVDGFRLPSPDPLWMLRTSSDVVYIYGPEDYVPEDNETIVFFYDSLEKYLNDSSLVFANAPEKPDSGCDVTDIINVTLGLEISIYRFNATLREVPRSNLLGMMVATSNHTDNTTYRLSRVRASFVSRTAGYVLDDLDELASRLGLNATDAFWELRDSAGTLIEEDVSSYIPSNDEFIQLVYVPGPDETTTGDSTPANTTSQG